MDIGYGEEKQRAAQELGCGKWVEGAGVSSDLVGEYTQADVVQLSGAVGAAHATFAPWACTTPKERHDILLRASTEILTGVRNWRAFSPAKEARPYSKQRTPRHGC